MKLYDQLRQNFHECFSTRLKSPCSCPVETVKAGSGTHVGTDWQQGGSCCDDPGEMNSSESQLHTLAEVTKASSNSSS